MVGLILPCGFNNNENTSRIYVSIIYKQKYKHFFFCNTIIVLKNCGNKCFKYLIPRITNESTKHEFVYVVI